MGKHLTSPWRHLTSVFLSNFYAFSVPFPSCIFPNDNATTMILIMHNDRIFSGTAAKQYKR